PEHQGAQTPTSGDSHQSALLRGTEQTAVVDQRQARDHTGLERMVGVLILLSRRLQGADEALAVKLLPCPWSSLGRGCRDRKLVYRDDPLGHLCPIGNPKRLQAREMLV